jgi:hypothetical protein
MYAGLSLRSTTSGSPRRPHWDGPPERRDEVVMSRAKVHDHEPTSKSLGFREGDPRSEPPLHPSMTDGLWFQ